MNEQPLDLRAFFRALRRGRLWIALLVMLGLAVGAGLVVGRPPMPRASALVIVPANPNGSASATPAQNDATQIIIATSDPVLRAAGTAVSPPVLPAQLRKHMSVTALSDQVLEVDVTAPTGAQAIKLTNAVVTDYIAYLVNSGSASTNGILAELRQEASSLSAQVTSLQDQINAVARRLVHEKASSAAGQRDASLLSSLRSEQQQVAQQLNSVDSQIVTAQLSSGGSNGARVLQQAAVVPPSRLTQALPVVAGGTLGLIAGCGLVLVRARRDRRLRLRDELAGAIGVPVLASLQVSPCRSTKDWQRVLQKYKPSPVDAWNLRRLLHRVVNEPAKVSFLNVVAFADDRSGLAAGVQLAKSAAELGAKVRLRRPTHPALSSLRAACTLSGGEGTDGDVILVPNATASDLAGAALIVEVVVVGSAKDELSAAQGAQLLAVSTGFATAELLARAALSAADAGIPLDGVVAVNPDPTDSTVGLVPQVSEPRRLARYSGHRAHAERTSGQLK